MEGGAWNPWVLVFGHLETSGIPGPHSGAQVPRAQNEGDASLLGRESTSRFGGTGWWKQEPYAQTGMQEAPWSCPLGAGISHILPCPGFDQMAEPRIYLPQVCGRWGVTSQEAYWKRPYSFCVACLRSCLLQDGHLCLEGGDTTEERGWCPGRPT